jgi:D-alanine-D-alanine ligase
LNGYARVDFRIDGAGSPWVLEINANPCIAQDAGFTAAAAQAGIPFEQLVEQIVRAALQAK